MGLCSVLFRLALAYDFEGARGKAKPRTTDDLDSFHSELFKESRASFSSSFCGNDSYLADGMPRCATAVPTEPPWFSLMLRLLSAAQPHGPERQRLVTFEAFQEAVLREPVLLCLFSWCLPSPPHERQVCIASCSTQRQDCLLIRFLRRLGLPVRRC